MLIIADTSCLSLLNKLGLLHLLGQIGQPVFITTTVMLEFGQAIPNDVQVVQVDLHQPELFVLEKLDAGEATSIALALQMPSSILIIDEAKGRKVAQSLGLKITGTIGLLVLAKDLGLIAALKPILEAIATTNFRIASNIIEKVLKEAGE